MATPTSNPNVRPVKVNYGAPAEGPAVVPYNLDFTTQSTYNVDLSNLFNLKYLSAVLTVFVDNSKNSAAVTITTPDSQTSLVWPPYSQGYLPVLQGVSLKFQVQTSGAFIVPMTFLNFPVAPSVWSVNPNPIVSGGAIIVSDPALEAAVSGGFFQSKGYLTYGDGTVQPEFVGSKWVTGTLTATTLTNIFTATTGWVLKSLKVSLSGNATLAAAGVVTVTASENSGGGTNIAVGTAFLGTAAPTNLTPPTTLIDLSAVSLTSKIAGSAFALQTNVVPNAGEIRYIATYGLTNFVGG